MQTVANRPGSHAAILMICSTALFLLTSCTWIIFPPRSSIDLTPFQDMARARVCSDIRNRLFLIDDQFVFSDVAGNCADASYSETLYGRIPDQVLCVWHDSIAGPMKNCQNEQYQDMFNTITAHLDQPDLGLGSEHTVQIVPF